MNFKPQNWQFPGQISIRFMTTAGESVNASTSSWFLFSCCCPWVLKDSLPPPCTCFLLPWRYSSLSLKMGTPYSEWICAKVRRFIVMWATEGGGGADRCGTPPAGFRYCPTPPPDTVLALMRMARVGSRVTSLELWGGREALGRAWPGGSVA